MIKETTIGQATITLIKSTNSVYQIICALFDTNINTLYISMVSLPTQFSFDPLMISK